jgi:AcrR family transcriptional regulator
MTSVKLTTDRTYAGRSGAQRAAHRRSALIDAAFELAAQDGWSQLRIDRICRDAGLNKRYFYESFADVDGVIAAVMSQVAADAIAVTLGAMDAAAPDGDLIHAGIAALVRHLTGDPRRARVLFGESPASEAVTRYRTEAIHQVIAAANARGRKMYRPPDEGDPMLELVGSLLVGGTRQAVLDWLDGRMHATLDDSIDDLVELWRAAAEATLARTQQR